jgi:hypothetical protein
VLASLPAGEVATLLKNLLPLLASGERDTLVPATRSLTLVLEEDEGRRRALSALKDGALRGMVLGLSALLRSPDAEVAYAALEASLKLLLDEEPSKRVLLVLAEASTSVMAKPVMTLAIFTLVLCAPGTVLTGAVLGGWVVCRVTVSPL